jgi:hypothetical protein
MEHGKWGAMMANIQEVTIERGGKQYGATYTVRDGMLHVKTHTETRSVELGDGNPQSLARNVLAEIVDAQPRS